MLAYIHIQANTVTQVSTLAKREFFVSNGTYKENKMLSLFILIIKKIDFNTHIACAHTHAAHPVRHM